MIGVPPIRREVIVAAGPAVAFEVFLEQIATWWPVDDKSVYGAGSSVAFLDGVITESMPGRPDVPWGRVTEWEPPTRLAFSWHPGATEDRASHVTVTFIAVGDHTLVRLEHSGWDAFADPAAMRAEYDHGWPVVLNRYSEAADAASQWTWVALLHRPTPNMASGTAVFDHPLFGEHLAFLNRMRAAGFLIAAGPLADESGAGMTVLRLPGVDRLSEARKLATTDDLSVVGGLFGVTVRPWQVVLHR